MNKRGTSDVKEDEDEEENEEHRILAEWNHLYKGRALTPNRIVERLRDNPTEDGIMFKYDFLTLFMNTMVEINKDGRCKTDFLECLGDDVAVEDVNRCKYICDSIKMGKDGWQRDSTSKYFNGALTILVNIMWNINMVRTSSPLSFWTKETLSRRQIWEIKNGGFGKGVLREGYVDTQVDVEHVMKEDRMKNVEQKVDKYEGEKKNVTFEEHVRMVESLMAETLRKKELLNKELDDIWYKYPNNVKVKELVREYDRTFRGENKMSDLLSRMDKVNNKENKVMDYEKDKKVNVKIKGGMKVFTRSRKRRLTDESDVLDGVSKNDECDAIKVDGVTKNDVDIKLDKVVGETIKWAETKKGVMKRQTRRRKEVDNTISTFVLLSQSSQRSPESDIGTNVHASVKDTNVNVRMSGKDTNVVDMNEPLNDDEKTIWQYLLTTIDDKRRYGRVL
ncbi:hypothetical protein HanRHA438_Chr12g0546211 [Helianthus annuus]|nr:hypothetical protein HanOQP8_Chr12g0441601 [Helianthus annuus]KAJ0865941.1 hypothetical protein HanRHA438_Chr12g0546211 [Helianthus annuus]